MSYFTDAQLEAMMADLESDRAERKQSFQGEAPQKVREAVCAFANDLAGHGEPGVVLIGVHDKGTPMPGFAVSDELLRQLADIKTDGNIVPPPTLLVEKRQLQGSEVAVITVWPCDTPPARYKGRIHVRWGPRRGLASAQDERILNERRRHRDRPFDVQPMQDAELADLDRLRFEQEYLPALVARDVLAANERSYEQKLAATKMVLSDEQPLPTVLGMLVIGKLPSDWLPGAYAQFLRLAGNDLTAPVADEEPIHGTVADQIRRLEEKLATPTTSARYASAIPTLRIVVTPTRWMRCASWYATPSCTAATRQPIRRCGCTGLTIASKFTIRVGRLAASRRRTLASPASPITATQIWLRRCARWGTCSASAQELPLHASRSGNGCALKCSPALLPPSSAEHRHDCANCLFQQQGRRRQDFARLPLRLHVCGEGLARAGGRS